MDEVYHHLDTHVLFKLHWGGRGVKGEEWRKLVTGDFKPRLERMWGEQTYLHPRALLGYFPCNSDGNELIVWDPAAPGERGLARSSASTSPRAVATPGDIRHAPTSQSTRRSSGSWMPPRSTSGCPVVTPSSPSSRRSRSSLTTRRRSTSG